MEDGRVPIWIFSHAERLERRLKRPVKYFIFLLSALAILTLTAFLLSYITAIALAAVVSFLGILSILSYGLYKKAVKDINRILWGQRAYYQGILSSRHESVFVIDRDFMVRDLSESFLKKNNMRREDAIGKPCHLVARGRNTPCSADNGNQCPVDHVFRTGRRRSCVQRHTMQNRDSIEIEVSASPLTRENDAVTLAVETVRDVTELSHLKALFLQAQKMEAVGRLAGGMAHDFNNLMNVVIGHSEMLLNRAESDKQVRRGLENILRAGERAAALTRQLLAFSRKQIMEPQILDLNSLLENMDMMLRRIIGEDIRLVTVRGEALGLVNADMMMMEQVIMNLAVNARDAMPDGGTLTIETKSVELDDNYVRTHHGARPGWYVMLAVSDTGVGMTPEVKARIFEPFFTTKEAGKGTGLGLSTVFGIIKQHEGYIMTYSEPGIGTTFKIYLPMVDAKVESTAKTAPAVIPKGSETILLVEDDEGVRTMASMMLEDLGYTVIQSGSGDAALELLSLHSGKVDLLLTDVVMPGMNGRHLAKKVTDMRPGIKVMFTSGYSDNVLADRGVLGPGIHFIQKPFTSSALGRKVREVLDGGS